MAHLDFNQTYLALHDRIYRLAMGIVGNRDEAQDVAQDLYERLWLRRESVTACENPGAYILAAARNLCLDRLRGRRPRVELPPTLPSTGQRPDEGDVAAIVARLVARLPERQRTVMMLRDVECMEIDQIAAVTGTHPTAVRMALSRARGTVRERLFKIVNYGI